MRRRHDRNTLKSAHFDWREACGAILRCRRSKRTMLLATNVSIIVFYHYKWIQVQALPVGVILAEQQLETLTKITLIEHGLRRSRPFFGVWCARSVKWCIGTYQPSSNIKWTPVKAGALSVALVFGLLQPKLPPELALSP